MSSCIYCTICFKTQDHSEFAHLCRKAIFIKVPRAGCGCHPQESFLEPSTAGLEVTKAGPMSQMVHNLIQLQPGRLGALGFLEWPTSAKHAKAASLQRLLG